MVPAAQCYRCGAHLDSATRSGLCAPCVEKLGVAQWLLDHPSGPAVDSTASKDHRFSNYELLGEIARGGMGVVYRARQLNLKRLVALKMIRPERMTLPRTAERFQLEAETAARLDHPNIVPIYEIGEVDGQHFYSMKLVEGRSLAREINGRPIPVHRAVDWTVEIARAVQYAHDRGVLHRDIKPGNILIDTTGRPQLLDFGLAKLLDADSTLTQPDAVMGSPAYMAPEQAITGSKQLTVAADIYSLGAVLYEAVSGRPPFQGETTMELMRQILDQEPKPPSALLLQPKDHLTPPQSKPADSSVDRDLDTICLKCLEKEPARRYPSASAFADDLDRWRRGEPIQARHATAWRRASKWVRRKPAIAGLTAVLVSVALAGVAGIIWQWRESEANRRQAQANLYAADMLLAGYALRDHDVGRTRALLAGHAPRPGEFDLRDWEWRYFNEQTRTRERFTLRPGSGAIEGIAFLDNNRLIAATDGVLSYWDLGARQMVHRHNHGSQLYLLKSSPDGRRFATSALESKRILIWDAEKCRVIYSITGALHSLGLGQDIEFFPDGRTIAVVQQPVGIQEGTLVLADCTETNKAPIVLACGPGMRSPTISPDGRVLAYQDAAAVVIRDLNTGQFWAVTNRLGQHLEAVSWRLAFSDDGRTLTLVDNRSVYLADAATGQLIESLPDHLVSPGPVLFTTNARRLISLGADQHIRVREIGRSHPAVSFQTIHDEYIAVSPDGRWIATGGEDGSIKIWDTQYPAEKNRWVFLNQPGSKRFTTDNRRFIVFQWNEDTTSIRVWEVPSGKPLAHFSVPGTDIRDVTIIGPQDHLALIRENHSVEIWPANGQPPITRFELAPATIHQKGVDGQILQVSSDGRRLMAVYGTGDNTNWATEDQVGPLGFYLFDVPGQRLIERWFVQPGIRVVAGDCSPLTGSGALGGFGGEVVILDGDRGMSLRKLPTRHQRYVTDARFSPDGRLLATTGAEGSVKLWDTASGREIATHKMHRAAALSVAFHPRGKRLFVGTTGAISVLDLIDLRQLTIIAAPPGRGVTRMRFLDEDTLVGWIGSWRAEPGDELIAWHAPPL